MIDSLHFDACPIDSRQIDALQAELARLDRLLACAVERARVSRRRPEGEFSSVYIAESEIDELLAQPSLAVSPPALASFAVDDESTCGGRLRLLAERLRLSAFERDMILMALAPELDRKYQRIYGYLHDAMPKTLPTPGLCESVLGGRIDDVSKALARSGPLAEWRIFLPTEAGEPRLSRPLSLDERIVDFLTGSDTLDNRLCGDRRYARWFTPRQGLEGLDMDAEVIRELAQVADASAAQLCVLRGPRGAGKKTAAAAISHRRGTSLLVCDLRQDPSASANLLPLLFREARLYNSAVYVDAGADAIASLAIWIDRHEGPLFLGDSSYAAKPAIEIEIPMPNSEIRPRIWTRLLGAHVDVELLSSAFRFTPAQIERAFERAQNAAVLNRESTIRIADLLRACRAESEQTLVAFSTKIPPRRTWDDLVLPAPVTSQLKELCGQVRHRNRVYSEWGFSRKLSSGKGLVALFSGPSGTGKTLSAEVLASDLGLSLFQVDLSAVMSKYIGDTEKALARLFDDAQLCNGILFFDEADSLFGKRTDIKDAHDRYANQSVNYILQRIEQYEGVVILASNMVRNIDAAFQRRMHFVVEFPFPDGPHRRRIWQGVFPAEAPIAQDLDFEYLATTFALAGGNIRNVALSAAFQAAGNGGRIGMDHLMLAMKREYQKLGKVCEKSDFGEYYPLVR